MRQRRQPHTTCDSPRRSLRHTSQPKPINSFASALEKKQKLQKCSPPHSSNTSNACCLPWHEEMEQFAETSLENQRERNESGPLGSYQQCKLAHRGTAWMEVSAFGPAAVAQVWRTRSHVLTLVSSWALARLSTAMAKKTFRSVSVGEQLRKNLHIANRESNCSSPTLQPSFSTSTHGYITGGSLAPLLCHLYF